MGRDYYVCLVCPLCLFSQWFFHRDLEMTRDEVLNSFWTFECPVHGLQGEKPLQAHLRNTFQEETAD